MINGSSATGNRITQNSIYENLGAGITLTDNGNGLLSAPIVNAATCDGGVVVYDPTCSFSTVEIFSDGIDEGRLYEGTAAPLGNGFYYWGGIASGPSVTATTRDSSGNTSAFSAAFPQGACQKKTYLPLIKR